MITKMAHVQLLGPRRMLPELIRCLQAQGVFQVRSLPDRLADDLVKKIPVEGEQVALQRRLEETALRLHELLLLLPALRGGPSEDLPDVASPGFLPRFEAIESEIRAASNRRLALHEEQDLIARYERLLTALSPLLRGFGGVKHVETVGILVRRDRSDVLAVLEREVGRITGGAYTMLSGEVDRDQMAVLLAIPREFARELSHLLFERGITEVRLPERYVGQPFIKTLTLLLQRSRDLPREIRENEEQLQALARRWHGPLTHAYRAATNRLTQLRAVAYCGQTGYAFIIAGWIPVDRYGELARTLEETFQGRVTLIERAIREEEYDEVPVVLRNPRVLRPFELLLSLLPLPRYGSVDPTPFLAVFFPLFFGLMLGDVGYGALALVLALMARRRGWGGETGRKFTTIVLASSVSAIVFGLLFGELFGELGRGIGLRPILLDRREAVLGLLGLAMAIGAIHIILGIGLAVWTALRHGKAREAVARSATLGLILAVIGAFLSRLEYLPPLFGRGALLAVGPLLVIAVVLEGFLAPLEIMKTMGNILSYARLMALGIASVMLADVANRMTVFFPLPVGVMVAVMLHGVNLAMGLFSPAIQALRLHYVEFFDKFYESGGRPYEPLALTP